MTLRILLLSLAMLSTTALTSESLQLQDDRVVIQVKGVVCSFCAHGAEKNLSKLDFLDKTAYGGDGVLLDISNQRITLALDPTKPVRLDSVHKAIIDGGYDPVIAYIRVRGRIEIRGGDITLISHLNGQRWHLQRQDETPISGQTVMVEGKIAAADFAKLSLASIIPLTVTKLEVRQ